MNREVTITFRVKEVARDYGKEKFESLLRQLRARQRKVEDIKAKNKAIIGLYNESIAYMSDYWTKHFPFLPLTIEKGDLGAFIGYKSPYDKNNKFQIVFGFSILINSTLYVDEPASLRVYVLEDTFDFNIVTSLGTHNPPHLNKTICPLSFDDILSRDYEEVILKIMSHDLKL